MKEQFIEKRFRRKSLDMIATCNSITELYMADGLHLTLRQLYYQLVSYHSLPNSERSYQNLSRLVSDARLAGLLDWEAIEDRGREPAIPSEWDSIESLVRSALYSYRLPRWKDQPTYTELWVEKQALAGVLQPLARQFHVTLMVNKGYSSWSAIKGAAERFREQGMDSRVLNLFYLGDHDPSGEDMVRDIEERLKLLQVGVGVTKLALTMDQIEQHNLPPNPAKLTDVRTPGYIRLHGEYSWEVDALPPNVLTTIIRDAFAKVIDWEKMNAVEEQEKLDKEKLLDLVAGF